MSRLGNLGLRLASGHLKTAITTKIHSLQETIMCTYGIWSLGSEIIITSRPDLEVSSMREQ